MTITLERVATEAPARTLNAREITTTETTDPVNSAFEDQKNLAHLDLIDCDGNPVTVSLVPSKLVSIMTDEPKSDFRFQQGAYIARVGGVRYVDYDSGEPKHFGGYIAYNTDARTLGMFWFVNSTIPYMTMSVRAVALT